MNPRHAAALALVGWYLMTPPVGNDLQIYSQAPLTEWRVEEAADSSDRCNDAKLALFNRADAEIKQQKHETLDPSLNLPLAAMKVALAAQCIASDDPRLKEK